MGWELCCEVGELCLGKEQWKRLNCAGSWSTGWWHVQQRKRPLREATWPVTRVSTRSSPDLEMCTLPLWHPLPLGCTIKTETDSADPVHKE